MSGEKNSKWDDRFLSLAETIGAWSKDPSTKVGAVIVDSEHIVVSVGYNGFPKGFADLEERYNDREFKYAHVVHAERNALIHAQRSVKGCTVYTTPFMPCIQCAVLLVQAGIKRVVSKAVINERWAKDFKLTEELFKETGVTLCLKQST